MCFLSTLFLYKSVYADAPCNFIRFVTIGDSGQSGEALASTAAAMKTYTDDIRHQFVAVVGDNFYPGGILNIDDPVFASTFIQPFAEIKSRFHPVLGDNDYGKDDRIGSLTAQMELSSIDSRWCMPNLYYSEIYSLGSVTICSLFLDTQSLIDIPEIDFRTPAELEWLSNQLTWLDYTLSTPSCQNSNFIIVFGHHTIFSAGKKHQKGKGKAVNEKLLPIFSKYHVDAYFSGHDHDLQAIQSDSCEQHCMSFIVSGASSRLRQTPKKTSLVGFTHWGVVDTYGFVVTDVGVNEMVTKFVSSKTGEILHSHVTKSHLFIRKM